MMVPFIVFLFWTIATATAFLLNAAVVRCIINIYVRRPAATYRSPKLLLILLCAVTQLCNTVGVQPLLIYDMFFEISHSDYHYFFGDHICAQDSALRLAYFAFSTVPAILVACVIVVEAAQWQTLVTLTFRRQMMMTVDLILVTLAYVVILLYMAAMWVCRLDFPGHFYSRRIEGFLVIYTDEMRVINIMDYIVPNCFILLTFIFLFVAHVSRKLQSRRASSPTSDATKSAASFTRRQLAGLDSENDPTSDQTVEGSRYPRRSADRTEPTESSASSTRRQRGLGDVDSESEPEGDQALQLQSLQRRRCAPSSSGVTGDSGANEFGQGRRDAPRKTGVTIESGGAELEERTSDTPGESVVTIESGAVDFEHESRYSPRATDESGDQGITAFDDDGDNDENDDDKRPLVKERGHGGVRARLGFGLNVISSRHTARQGLELNVAQSDRAEVSAKDKTGLDRSAPQNESASNTQASLPSVSTPRSDNSGEPRTVNVPLPGDPSSSTDKSCEDRTPVIPLPSEDPSGPAANNSCERNMNTRPPSSTDKSREVRTPSVPPPPDEPSERAVDLSRERRTKNTPPAANPPSNRTDDITAIPVPGSVQVALAPMMEEVMLRSRREKQYFPFHVLLAGVLHAACYFLLFIVRWDADINRDLWPVVGYSFAVLEAVFLPCCWLLDDEVHAPCWRSCCCCCCRLVSSSWRRRRQTNRRDRGDGGSVDLTDLA